MLSSTRPFLSGNYFLFDPGSSHPFFHCNPPIQAGFPTLPLPRSDPALSLPGSPSLLLPSCSGLSPQRPKNAGGRVALPPGRFGSIRKIYGHSLLKTSLKNRFKICPYSSRCFRTAQIMSRQPKMCPDRLVFYQDSSKYIRTD